MAMASGISGDHEQARLLGKIRDYSDLALTSLQESHG